MRRRACVGRSHCNTSSAFGHFCSGHMVWLDPPHGPLPALRDTASEQEGDGPWWRGAFCREGQSGEIWEQGNAAGLVCPKDCPGNQLPVTLPRGFCCSGCPCPLESLCLHNTCSNHSQPQFSFPQLSATSHPTFLFYQTPVPARPPSSMLFLILSLIQNPSPGFCEQFAFLALIVTWKAEIMSSCS